MKRPLIFIFALIILAFCSVNVFAGSSARADITASSSKINVGDEIVFTVSLSGCPSAKALAIIPAFDTDVFEYVVRGEDNAQCGEALISCLIFDFGFSEKNAVIAFASPADINKSVLTFTLKAKKSTDMTTVTCDVIITTADNESISLGGVSSSINVLCQHSFGEWKRVDALEHKRVCYICGVQENAIHNFGAWEMVTPASQGSAGKEKRACVNCYASEEREVAYSAQTTVNTSTPIYNTTATAEGSQISENTQSVQTTPTTIQTQITQNTDISSVSASQQAQNTATAEQITTVISSSADELPLRPAKPYEKDEETHDILIFAIAAATVAIAVGIVAIVMYKKRR